MSKIHYHPTRLHRSQKPIGIPSIQRQVQELKAIHDSLLPGHILHAYQGSYKRVIDFCRWNKLPTHMAQLQAQLGITGTDLDHKLGRQTLEKLIDYLNNPPASKAFSALTTVTHPPQTPKVSQIPNRSQKPIEIPSIQRQVQELKAIHDSLLPGHILHAYQGSYKRVIDFCRWNKLPTHMAQLQAQLGITGTDLDHKLGRQTLEKLIDYLNNPPASKAFSALTTVTYPPQTPKVSQIPIPIPTALKVIKPQDTSWSTTLLEGSKFEFPIISDVMEAWTYIQSWLQYDNTK